MFYVPGVSSSWQVAQYTSALRSQLQKSLDDFEKLVYWENMLNREWMRSEEKAEHEELYKKIQAFVLLGNG